MNLSRVPIGVVMGGPSSEHEVSLASGKAVFDELSRAGRRVERLFIDRDGVWYRGERSVAPEEALRRVEVVVNALHGEYGEDGKIQRLLGHFNIPYTGSGSLASAWAMNKARTRQHLDSSVVRHPVHRIVTREQASQELVEELFTTFPQPCVIKPLALGSSVGVSIAGTRAELTQALDHVFTLSRSALVDEYLAGREATCGVVENFRGEELYALPVVEIKPPSGGFFDYNAKYSGVTEEIVPGNFSDREREIMQAMAREAHRRLGLRHYSRTDFIVHPRRGVYMLEVNTLPGMTTESLFPKSLSAVGSGLGEFLDHIVDLACS